MKDFEVFLRSCVATPFEEDQSGLYRFDFLKNQEAGRRENPRRSFTRPSYQEGRRFSEKPDLQNQSSQTGIKKAPAGAVAVLEKALHFCLAPPASRFRPRLCFATADLFRVKPERLFPYAAAIEMIHCGSLAQDDLPVMDNSSQRRGRPAAHKVFGEDMALLAGSCLFVEAFSVLSRIRPQTAAPPLFRLLSEKAGFQGMMAGQAMDIRRDDSLSSAMGKRPGSAIKFFQRLYRLKTGALIEAAASGAALFCGASEKEKSALGRFAKDLGAAYQTADDLKDGEKSPIASHKKLSSLIQRALSHIENFRSKAATLRELALFIQNRSQEK